MKATGIVRRIEACGIITQVRTKPHKYWVSADFVQKYAKHEIVAD